MKYSLIRSIASVLIVSFLLVLVSSCKTQTIYKSAWYENSEGKVENKNNYVDNIQYNSDAKMLYSIINDNKNLYVLLEVSDKTVQKKILMGGLTFWMDTIGEKEKQLGVTFPMKGSMKNKMGKMNKEEMMKQMQNGSLQGEINYHEINDKFESSFNKMELIGFNNEKEPMIVFNKNPKGINTTIRFDNKGTLNYRASIPLKLIFNNPNEFLSDSTKLFSFGFETGAVKMPSMGSGGKSGGGKKGGGMSQGGGSMQGKGGHGGGQSAAGMSGMQELSKPNKFWVKSTRLVKA